MTEQRVMPVCKFCGTECEAGRNPQDGWCCNACGHWQDEHYCNACGSWTTVQAVERHRVRATVQGEGEP